MEAAVDDSVGVATTGLLLLALQTLTGSFVWVWFCTLGGGGDGLTRTSDIVVFVSPPSLFRSLSGARLNVRLPLDLDTF